MKRLSLATLLALLLALCLLATAGPALAAYPPQWGAHEINGRFTYVSENEVAITFQCVASDPRVSGDLVVVVEDTWVSPADNLLHASGYYDLTNDGGSWHCDYWESVYGKVALVDKSAWGFVFQTDAIGGPAIGQTGGGYTGLIFRSSNHSGGGKALYIIKGWILPE